MNVFHNREFHTDTMIFCWVLAAQDIAPPTRKQVKRLSTRKTVPTLLVGVCSKSKCRAAELVLAPAKELSLVAAFASRQDTRTKVPEYAARTLEEVRKLEALGHTHTVEVPWVTGARVLLIEREDGGFDVSVPNTSPGHLGGVADLFALVRKASEQIGHSEDRLTNLVHALVETRSVQPAVYVREAFEVHVLPTAQPSWEGHPLLAPAEPETSPRLGPVGGYGSLAIG